VHLLQTKNVRIERIQYPKSNRKRCREELVFEYPNGVVIPFSQHVSGRNTPIRAGERGHDREGKGARRHGGSAPPHATRRSEFPSEDLTIFMDYWMFTGCLGVRRQGAAVRHPKFGIPTGGLKLRFFTSRSDQRIRSTYINALIRRAGCSRRIFWVFCTVLGAGKRGEEDARTKKSKKLGENRGKTGKKIGGLSGGLSMFTRGFIYPQMNLNKLRDRSDSFAPWFEPTLMAHSGEAHRADAFIYPPIFSSPWVCTSPDGARQHRCLAAARPKKYRVLFGEKGIYQNKVICIGHRL